MRVFLRIPAKTVSGTGGAIDRKWKPYQGKFLDTMTLGRALLLGREHATYLATPCRGQDGG